MERICLNVLEYNEDPDNNLTQNCATLNIVRDNIKKLSIFINVFLNMIKHTLFEVTHMM